MGTHGGLLYLMYILYMYIIMKNNVKKRLVNSNKIDLVLELIIRPIKLCLQASPLLQHVEVDSVL